MQSGTAGRAGSIEEAAVKFSCFGLGRKKAKPLTMLDCECDAAMNSRAKVAARLEDTSLATQSSCGQKADASVRDHTEDASPRNWLRSGNKQSAFNSLTEPIERIDSAHHTSDEECHQSVSGDTTSMTMHDSTSSLKEGIHGVNKKDILHSYAPHRDRVKEEQDEDLDEDQTYLKSEWEINPHDIFFVSKTNGKLSRLGKGAFGTVYKGVWRDEAVAVKVCRQQHISVKAMKQFQKEVSILHGCDHPSIVQFKGACCWKGGKRTVLVTEFMEKGDLCTALGRAPGRYSWSKLGRGIALDVARGLAFLHAMNVVHFDLKSANILLDQDNRAKLADVGLAKTLTHYHGTDQLSTFMATGDLGTFAWAAPEVLLGFACDAKADIFSFGVVMWELATTEMPQGRCLRPIRVPEEASDDVADLIMDCLRHDASARPTALQLVDILSNMIRDES